MTALNMFIQPRARAGYIIADTAVLDSSGAVIESCSKVAISTGAFPFAIGMTGTVHPRAVLPVIGAADCKTLKQLIRRLPDVLHAALDTAREAMAAAGEQPSLGLKAVAWDFARKRPVGLQIGSDRSMCDLEPFQLYEAAYSLMLHDGVSGIDQITGGVDVTDPVQFDPEADGLAMIERQRIGGTTTLLPGGSVARHTVGCEAQLFTVTKRGVTCHCLREWPDQIGFQIEPVPRLVANFG